MTAGENASAMMAWAIGADMVVDLDLLGQSPLEPAHGQPLGADEALRVVRAEGLDEPRLLGRAEAVAEGEDIGFVDADPLRVALLDGPGQGLPLVLLVRLPDGREQAADAVAVDGEPLDALLPVPGRT